AHRLLTAVVCRPVVPLRLAPSHCPPPLSGFFLCIDPPPPEIYTLSLHDALPIYAGPPSLPRSRSARNAIHATVSSLVPRPVTPRSEEHTSELQSRENLVCRLLLEKKKFMSSVAHDISLLLVSCAAQ